MVQHRVDQRPMPVAGRRVHHHAGRFVDHQQIGVLIRMSRGSAPARPRISAAGMTTVTRAGRDLWLAFSGRGPCYQAGLDPALDLHARAFRSWPASHLSRRLRPAAATSVRATASASPGSSSTRSFSTRSSNKNRKPSGLPVLVVSGVAGCESLYRS